MVPINFLAVFIAAIISMPLGMLWYGPLFGKQWIKLSGIEQKRKDARKSGNSKMAIPYLLMFLGSLVMSFVLAHAMVFSSAYLHMGGIPAGLMTGFFNWIGFIAPVTMGSVLWEGKSWKLWTINNGYYIVLLLCMGIILSVMQ